MKINKYFLVIILIGFVMLFIGYSFRHRIIRKINGAFQTHISVNQRNNGGCPNCAAIFVDNVEKHKGAYRKEGIKPQKYKSGFIKYLKSGKLRILSSSKFFNIDKLCHSSPYLMPKAIDFLHDLSKLYKNKCNKNKIQFAPFTISSLTRTKTDVLELKCINKNAILDSPHLKGKTFDVNYHAFNQNKSQTKCFIAALSELRERNRCFVKFERNGCLHITVI